MSLRRLRRCVPSSVSPRCSAGLRRWGPWGVLLLFWAWKTSDIWRHVTSRHYALWGVFFDTINMVWMSWWSDVAAHSAEGLFETSFVNYPSGSPTALAQSLAWFHVALAGLLRGVTGYLFAHNVLAMASFGISLSAVYLLLRHLTAERWLSLVLTILVVTYGLSWGRTLPDLELVSFGYFAFAMLAWLRYSEAGGWWRLLLAMSLVGWTGFVQMYYGLALFIMLVMGVVAGALGRTPPGVPPRQMMTRTAQVLGLALCLSALLHLRNLLNVLNVSEPPHWNQFFRFSWWQGVLLLIAVLTPILVAERRGKGGAVFFGLLMFPVAILSMGEFVEFGTGGPPVSLPLNWLRLNVPLMYRITFCFRFVAPTLLALAALYALFWREAGVRAPGDDKPGAASTIVLVTLFWLTAGFAPMIPRFELEPLQAAVSADAMCVSDQPDSCSLVQARVAWCRDGRGEIPSRAWWALSQAVAPLLPVATVEMPAAPPCVLWLMRQEDRRALLEFAYREPLAYSGYFQTMHQRPVVGFPTRYLEAASQLTEPSPLTKLQSSYRRREPFRLPASRDLEDIGIGYVVIHRDAVPETCHLGPSDQAPSRPDAMAPAVVAEDFVEAYGAPVCTDPRLIIYQVSADGRGRR
ncbi:MAG: hypothetical protein ABIK09_08940 [Pseudomonadota bacterium]